MAAARPVRTRVDSRLRFLLGPVRAASPGPRLHHIALKTPDIDGTLGALAAAGLPLIDARGRPGSRRALIGFLHPRALGGVLLHLVQRPG